MEFHIEIPDHKPYDAVALGLNAVDHLIVVPHYPDFNSKVAFLSHTLAPGGQCATAMVALARLGLRTRYIGKVGSDDIGRFQIDSLISEGVEARDVAIVEGAETQTAFIIIDRASGERTIIWNRDERLDIAASEVERDAVTSGRVLLLDGHNVAASIAAATYARDAGVPVVLDIDNVYDGTERLLPLIDLLISSSTFPERMTGEADLRAGLRALANSFGCRFVAATLGQDGALACYRSEFISSPAFKVECKDTTGAGDAFHGGFIYGLLNRMSVEETLRFANAVAALKCREIGGRTALPTLDEVDSLLAGTLLEKHAG
ncbi:MAG TPA: PfkB family carbohydrate kinase [Blastocatellia bacterium]|nr:PfkB family carbohydrate kinase [Blastocatellia bacterium]